MSVELVVSNPHVIRTPRVTRASTARARLEAQYRATTRYHKGFRLETGAYIHFAVWPLDDAWRLSYTLHIGPTPFDSADGASYPTKLAAFDHGVACLRRLTRAAEPKFPVDAARIWAWIRSLEVPK